MREPVPFVALPPVPLVLRLLSAVSRYANTSAVERELDELIKFEEEWRVRETLAPSGTPTVSPSLPPSPGAAASMCRYGLPYPCPSCCTARSPAPHWQCTTLYPIVWYVHRIAASLTFPPSAIPMRDPLSGNNAIASGANLQFRRLLRRSHRRSHRLSLQRSRSSTAPMRPRLRPPR